MWRDWEHQTAAAEAGAADTPPPYQRRLLSSPVGFVVLLLFAHRPLASFLLSICFKIKHFPGGCAPPMINQVAERNRAGRRAGGRRAGRRPGLRRLLLRSPEQLEEIGFPLLQPLPLSPRCVCVCTRVCAGNDKLSHARVDTINIATGSL